MPIEVMHNFGPEPANPRGAHRTNRHFLKNIRVLRQISGGRDIMRVWVSICHLVGHIKNAAQSSNRGVVFAKDGIILVQRLNRGPVLVSNIIDYDSTDPHPVAAIAYWASEAARNPTRVESSDEEHDSDEEQGGDDDQDGGTDPQAGARRPHPTGSGPVTRQTRRRVSPSGTSAPGGVGGNVQPGAQPPAQQHPAEQISYRKVTPTKAVAAGDATSQEDPLAVELDLAAAELTFVCGSRCGFVYKGRWSDGQAVVVKAAPRDNRVAMEELRTEIRAYHRLADLQGTVLPQLVAHGRGCIEGRSVGVLAIELISGEAFLEPGEMDKRPVLKELTTSERFACVKALAAIHRRGVVHRDVRGANLLFRPSAGGAGRTPVFIDFGFAWFEGEHKRKAMRTERADDYEWLQGAFEGESKYA
ncbi:hypothetical protein H4R21_001599 [Coemansia helicoidea]|uniref:Uncharacterized protein n=2 Tax=Coemansia TaxID=4863 RepID=A0ACC1LC20_9FUNG|nr:hypothetical protein H4R21_001599 [Coemansia helicoidea]